METRYSKNSTRVTKESTWVHDSWTKLSKRNNIVTEKGTTWVFKFLGPFLSVSCLAFLSIHGLGVGVRYEEYEI